MAEEKNETDIGTGEETHAETVVSTHMATLIHMFLSALAFLLLVTAAITTVDTIIRDFPQLLRPPTDQYGALQRIIENLLLIAITAEFGLLLLFRRLSAAVEVVVFVLARKTINPEIHAYEVLLCAVGIGALIIVRFYYLPGKTT